MDSYTLNGPPSQWDAYFAGERSADAQASQRSTTSSRYPGVKFRRAVYGRGKRGVVVCPGCGALRRNFDTPHAPHWRNGVLVDCVGRPVR